MVTLDFLSSGHGSDKTNQPIKIEKQHCFFVTNYNNIILPLGSRRWCHNSSDHAGPTDTISGDLGLLHTLLALCQVHCHGDSRPGNVDLSHRRRVDERQRGHGCHNRSHAGGPDIVQHSRTLSRRSAHRTLRAGPAYAEPAGSVRGAFRDRNNASTAVSVHHEAALFPSPPGDNAGSRGQGGQQETSRRASVQVDNVLCDVHHCHVSQPVGLRVVWDIEMGREHHLIFFPTGHTSSKLHYNVNAI